MYWSSIRSGGRLSSQLRVAASILFLLILVVIFVATVAADSPGSNNRKVTTKVLVLWAPIQGSNGLAVDSDDQLYIASVLGREILIMNPRSGKIITRFGPADNVQGPDDLSFGPDGSLYWTDILTGEVGRREPDGKVTKQYVAPFVNPIAFSPDGRLFVAQAFVDDGLYEIDPELVEPPRLVMGGGNPALHLNGMAFGPDGKLYAPRQQLNQIVRIDVDTTTVEILTDEFEGACKFDSQGRLHVAADNRVVRLNPDTGEATTVATVPDGSDNLVFDSQDNIYVSNFRDGSIHKILPSGIAQVRSPGGLIAPGGIAVLPDDDAGESVFIADFWTVREFDGLNGQAGVAGRDFFFDSPMSAAADGQNLILSSWFGNTVEVWSPDKLSILEEYLFNVPIFAARFQGDLVVSELGSGSVVRQDAVSGQRETLAENLIVPAGLAYSDDDLWVADWATGTVWQIVADGIRQNPPVPVAAGLATPEGLALDHDGSLLVVESSAGRVSRIDPTTGEVTIIVEGLAIGAPAAPGWPPTNFFNGLAVGERGDIFVSGDAGSVIYRIKSRP
jgi:sugar lactone lactonase YvrE